MNDYPTKIYYDMFVSTIGYNLIFDDSIDYSKWLGKSYQQEKLLDYQKYNINKN